MADLKISQLSSATALAGTEVVPVVQGGSTKKATIDQILAPASGKGVNFAAAGGDTLTIYDEGTWTPSLTNISGVTSLANGSIAAYTKIGNVVTVSLHFTCASVSAGGSFRFSLPFATKGATVGVSVFGNGFPDDIWWKGRPASTTTIACFASGASASSQDINMSFSYIAA